MKLIVVYALLFLLGVLVVAGWSLASRLDQDNAVQVKDVNDSGKRLLKQVETRGKLDGVLGKFIETSGEPWGGYLAYGVVSKVIDEPTEIKTKAGKVIGKVWLAAELSFVNADKNISTINVPIVVESVEGDKFKISHAGDKATDIASDKAGLKNLVGTTVQGYVFIQDLDQYYGDYYNRAMAAGRTAGFPKNAAEVGWQSEMISEYEASYKSEIERLIGGEHESEMGYLFSYFLRPYDNEAEVKYEI